LPQQKTARAGIHRRHEGEAGGVGEGRGRASESDDPVFQWLAEGLQGIAAELGQLIEEEDAVVGEADFSRARDAAAADEAGVGDGVIRGAEGTASNERMTGRLHPIRCVHNISMFATSCDVRVEVVDLPSW
jgi:hypothetical protein